jgi:polyphosphate kinase
MGKPKDMGFISTGNFNEATAKIYTDILFESSTNFKDITKIFEFFYQLSVHRYKHLIVSTHYTRTRFYKLIDRNFTCPCRKKNIY